LAFFANSSLADLGAPAVLSDGDTFHWVFVTSTTTDAASGDIGVYNDFVNDVADASTLSITNVVGVTSFSDITWSAMASTSTVDAKDNIGDIQSPIYNTKNQFTASNEGQLFNAELTWPWSVDENGIQQYSKQAWTGTAAGSGGVATGYPLGSVWPNYGASWYKGATRWFGTWANSNTEQYGLYAISEELTVGPTVPVPGAAVLGMIGIGMVGAYTRKRRQARITAA